MKVQFNAKTIEVTKTFAEKAARFGSQEYKLLREALRDFPDYQVVVKPTTTHRRTYIKGLTYEYMEIYISKCDKDGSIMNEFQYLRQGCNYAVAKKWFLMKFPEVNNFAA